MYLRRAVLASLTNLTSLGLENNQISDIKPLASLTNLTKLYLEDNQISDIKALESLTNLTELYLNENPIAPETCPLKSESICKWASRLPKAYLPLPEEKIPAY